MFTVVYHFQVKPGLERDFEAHWQLGTELIKIERKSLGSRLHKSADGSYVAYAQWPTRESWINPPTSSQELKDALQRQGECLSKSEITFELEVIKDLLA